MSLMQILSSLFDYRRLAIGLLSYPGFISDLVPFRSKGGQAKIKDLFPVLIDKTAKTPVDYHYFYQDLWAFKEVDHKHPSKYVDVGSNYKLVGFLTSLVPVEFIDIRPLPVVVKNLKYISASVLEMPYRDASIGSLSCLHVAEHIGLGRYGDQIDPLGTEKACRELSRVLALDGDLYFSLPLGRPRICFNAHRIHSYGQIIRYFPELTLLDFAAVDDRGVFWEHADPGLIEQNEYACGMFHFTKRSL